MFQFSSFLPAGMARALLAMLILALRLPAAAQVPAWQSAQAVATATAAVSNFSEVRGTAVDAAGNVYLAGNFTSTMVLGGTTLTSLGSFDVFVAKFNPVSNQFVWALRAGGTGSDQASTLAMSGTSVYVAGGFVSPTASFGTTTLTNSGSADMFVAKLTDAGSTGSFAWAQRASGTGYEVANTLAVSGTSVYVAGYFDSATTSFGPTTLTNAGISDVFVAKITDAGSTASFAWAQRAGGSSYDKVAALVISGTSVYIAGYFNSPLMGLGTISLTNTSGTGSSDVFVAKLTDAGNIGSFVWAQQAGGTGGDEVSALAVSGTSVYVAGSFDSPRVGFGSVILTNSVGAADVFVAKLTDAGSTTGFAWAQQAGGLGEDYASSLAVSGTNVYVGGYFLSPTVGFGSTTLTNAGAGSSDLFVAKLADAGSTGSFVWAQRAGGTGNDYANVLALGNTSVHVAGFFLSSTASFGTIILSNPNPGTSLGFLASLTDPTLTATAASHTLAPATVYPNPAHGTATLRLPAGTASAPLTLTDALGRTVRRYSAPVGPEASLDLQGLPAGFYLLRGAGLAQRLLVE